MPEILEFDPDGTLHVFAVQLEQQFVQMVREKARFMPGSVGFSPQTMFLWLLVCMTDPGIEWGDALLSAIVVERSRRASKPRALITGE